MTKEIKQVMIILPNNLQRFEGNVLSYLLDKEEGMLAGIGLKRWTKQSCSICELETQIRIDKMLMLTLDEPKESQ